MIDALKPYPEYKDAREAWLGAIPAHWETRRNGRLFAHRVETGFPDLPVLEVSIKTGVRIRNLDSAARKQVMSDFSKYKRTCQGDIAYNMMRMWQGAVGVSPVDGLVSPAYVVARPHAGTNTRFFDYLFRTRVYMDEVNNFSRGIVADRNRLYWDEFKQMPSPFPPPAEQAGIVRFLGAVDRKVNRFIRAKRRLIEVLTEQKQAIITHAVTRGLNPAATLKPSGIDWLGDVPAHWDVQRLKWLAHIKTGGRDTVHRKDDAAYPFFVRSQTVERIDTYCFDGEAVLTAGDGAGVAKVFHYVDGKFDYHQRVYKFSDFRRVRGKFFFHYFSVTLRFEAFRETAKSTVDSLRLPMLQDFPVPIPPLEEQDAIVAYVEEQTSDINKSISLIRGEIDLIREYRTRLVADVVTGKVDVRAAAAAIPDEAADAGTDQGAGADDPASGDDDADADLEPALEGFASEGEDEA